MTPLARRVMEKVREKDHGTYERWFQAIVDATLDEVAARLDGWGDIYGDAAAADICKLKEPT